MRYGMNPHQPASIVAGYGPRVINGEPSMINYLDALNAFELVREADDATGAPAAASFKHVSPAGAALAGPVDATAARIWRVDESAGGGLLSAYVRARDADPKSSFGDVVALSRPVDLATAEFLRTVICDAVIAPGFEPGTAEVLAAKRDGRFLVLEADPDRTPPAIERRDVLGVTIEQERDASGRHRAARRRHARPRDPRRRAARAGDPALHPVQLGRPRPRRSRDRDRRRAAEPGRLRAAGGGQGAHLVAAQAPVRRRAARRRRHGPPGPAQLADQVRRPGDDRRAAERVRGPLRRRRPRAAMRTRSGGRSGSPR